MTSLFDVDFADEQEHNQQGRRATAAALARTRQRFGSFLGSGPDIAARFDFIESDFKQVVADVVAEYGGDADRIESSVTAVLAAGGYCDTCKVWKSGPRAGECTCDGSSPDDDGDSDLDDKTSKDHWIQDAVKKPGQLHKDLGVPEGEKIPEGKLEEAEHSKNKKVRERAQFAENVKKAAAGFCPSCGTRGQLLGKMGNRDMYQCPGCGSKYAEFDTDPARGQIGVMPEQTTQAPPAAPGQWDTSNSVGPPGFTSSSRWRVVGEALETEKLPKVPFGGDTLDGPSPKMDHKKWKPNATNPDGNLKPIDTEGAGSPHPTEHHDIARSTDHTRDPFEQTRGGKGVTETEKLKGHDDPDKAGFDTKKNITQYPTRTFGDEGQQQKAWGNEAYPKESSDANPSCDQCGKPMNPVDKMVGGTCLACAKKNQQEVTGAANVNCELCEDRVPKASTQVVDGLRLCTDCRGNDTSDDNQTSDLERQERESHSTHESFATPEVHQLGQGNTGHPQPQQPQGRCPNCNQPADPPNCPHCGYQEHGDYAGDPSQSYGGGHAMDDPDPTNGGQYMASGDPDKNPIRESLRAEHGLLPLGELDAAISRFRS